MSCLNQKQEKSGRVKSHSPHDLNLFERINFEDNKINDNDNKNTIHFINKNNKNSSRKKILLNILIYFKILCFYIINYNFKI